MRLGTLHLRSADGNNHMPMSPANPLRSTPIERSHRAQLALRVDLRVVGWRKKIFEFEVEVSGTASGTPHKGEASRRRQSAPSFSASTAPRKRSSSRWRAAACWKSAARVEPAARRRHGRRHGGYGRFAAARTGPDGRSVERRRSGTRSIQVRVHEKKGDLMRRMSTCKMVRPGPAAPEMARRAYDA